MEAVETSAKMDHKTASEDKPTWLEKLMMGYGRFVSKFWFAVGPAVVIMLLIFNVGWTKVEKSPLPFERLWSTRGGRLASEWDYYEDYVVKPHRTSRNTVVYVDRITMDGNEGNGRGGNILTKAGLGDMLRVHQAFFDTTVTTSTGNTYGARDLCERLGPADTPGPIVAPGANTSVDGVGKTNLTGRWQEGANALPGFLYTTGTLGTGITDQHRADAYFAFNDLMCPELLRQNATALAAWDKPVAPHHALSSLRPTSRRCRG